MIKNAFVVKTWLAGNRMDGNGNYVIIEGRAGGFVSWLLNLLGISPTVCLKVRSDKIIYEQGSLEGRFSFLTPLENTCSMFYAYKRPLKEAIVIGVLLGAATFFLLGIPGILIGVLYYILNKRLIIGFTDIGGRVTEIAFKRSVIEGKVIDQSDAVRVCDILQSLVDARREPNVNTGGSHAASVSAPQPDPPSSLIWNEQPSAYVPTPRQCPKCGQPIDAGIAFCDECGTQVG